MEYTANFYKNAILQKSLKGLNAIDAYMSIVTKEMVIPDVNGRTNWHVMARNLCVPRLSVLFVGETLRVAWQTEMVGTEQLYMLIQRTK